MRRGGLDVSIGPGGGRGFCTAFHWVEPTPSVVQRRSGLSLPGPVVVEQVVIGSDYLVSSGQRFVPLALPGGSLDGVFDTLPAAVAGGVLILPGTEGGAVVYGPRAVLGNSYLWRWFPRQVVWLTNWAPALVLDAGLFPGQWFMSWSMRLL